MSYLVLARKWRPETFSQVVGQKHVVTTLAAALRKGRIAHAYLFAGPRGVGKTTVARILAKALNCEKDEKGDPCASCPSCVEIAAGRSLDVIEIDGASNRRIEDARGIRETVQYAPLSGRMKVYIIDEAHMLTREAFNALLKTLEEPPPHVVFVLATTEPSKIPDTIASRCQRFDFHRVAASDIEARLAAIAEAEGVKADPAALRLLAARADGSVRDAEGLFDQLIAAGLEEIGPDDVASVLGIPRTEVFRSITDAVAARDTGAALRAFASALDAGFDPGDLADGMVEHLRDLLVRAATAQAGREREGAAAAAGQTGLGEDEIVRLLRIAVEAQAQARWSTQPSLLFELALARMARLPRTVEIEEIVRALGRGDAPSGQNAPPSAEGGAAGAGGGGTDSPPAAERSACPSWDGVVSMVRAKKPALAAFLTEAVASPPAEGQLRVLIPNGSAFHRQQLEDRGNMALLERAASDAFGGPLKVKLAFGGAPRISRAPGRAAGDSGAAQEGGRARGASSDAPARAAGTAKPGAHAGGDGDAVVRKVLEMFDGEIRETRREDETHGS